MARPLQLAEGSVTPRSPHEVPTEPARPPTPERASCLSLAARCRSVSCSSPARLQRRSLTGCRACRQFGARRPEPLTLRVYAPSELSRGQTATFKASLVNETDAPIRIITGGHPGMHVVVDRDDGGFVWANLDGVAVTSIAIPKALAPGDSVVVEQSWDLRTKRGARVPAGMYRVELTVHADVDDDAPRRIMRPFPRAEPFRLLIVP